jgi:hypothetical protein
LFDPPQLKPIRLDSASDMISGLTALLLSMSASLDTTLVLGRVERDLTGDGKPEVLRLVGTGKTIDSLDVTLSIESLGATIYRIRLAPVTRRVGFDGDRRMRSPAQQRAWLADVGASFFHRNKFLRPIEFIASWRAQAPGHVAEIPGVIARDGRFFPDTVRAAAIWREIEAGTGTIFEFSPGGDGIIALGWSKLDARFYRLVECC